MIEDGVNNMFDQQVIKDFKTEISLKKMLDPMVFKLRVLLQMEKRLENMIPIKILNKVTKGDIDKDSTKTYERLIKVLTDEYHYVLLNESVGGNSKKWSLRKTKNTIDNSNMNEILEIIHSYSEEEIIYNETGVCS